MRTEEKWCSCDRKFNPQGMKLVTSFFSSPVIHEARGAITNFSSRLSQHPRQDPNYYSVKSGYSTVSPGKNAHKQSDDEQSSFSSTRDTKYCPPPLPETMSLCVALTLPLFPPYKCTPETIHMGDGARVHARTHPDTRLNKRKIK